MEKQPLTTEGVTLKQVELYALSPELIKKEIQNIRDDFKGWLLTNFSLSEDEKSSLQNMDPSQGLYLGSEIGAAIEGQLPITFEKDDRPPFIEHGSKRIRLKKDVILQPSGPSSPNGGFTIEIYYETT